MRQDVCVPHPEQIGRYRISQLLGSGGFASVWLGTDDRLEEPVAIKVLAENWSNTADIRDRFLQEARMLRRADSDRVVRMYDIDELPDGRPYFVMSYADRGTVEDRMKEPLPIRDVLHIVLETALAVAVLHRLGVVHRDIKPSNVLVQSVPGGERFLIGDLGVAKHVAQASGFTIVAGTPGYMAPEQADLSLGIDVRADVYGLGALTYHLLTGTKYDAAGLRKAALPKKLKQVMTRALEQDRERRWADASAYAEAIAGLIEEDEPDDEATTVRIAGAEPAPNRPAGRFERRSRFVAAGACLLIAAVVVTTLVLTRKAADRNAAINGPDLPVVSSTTSSSPSTTTTTKRTTKPAAKPSSPPATPLLPLGPLEITFSVGSASGYVVRGSGVDGPMQWANLAPSTGGSSNTQLSVYRPGTFDPAQAQDGAPIEVAGRHGFYDAALPDPETGDSPATQTSKPAAVVEYVPGAWYVVQSDLPPAQARAAVTRIAEAVRLDSRRQLRYPVRFGQLPAGLTACGGLDGLDAGWSGPWNAWVDLCDDLPGTGIGPSTTAVRMMMNLRDGTTPPPQNGTIIGGHKVEFTISGATVDCADFVLSIWVSDNHQQRYGQPVVQAIAENLTVRAFGDKARWFAADVAVPRS
jgi:serine/threonine protein kinase